jgi:hypothetical protein
MDPDRDEHGVYWAVGEIPACKIGEPFEIKTPNQFEAFWDQYTAQCWAEEETLP